MERKSAGAHFNEIRRRIFHGCGGLYHYGKDLKNPTVIILDRDESGVNIRVVGEVNIRSITWEQLFSFLNEEGLDCWETYSYNPYV